MTTMGNARAFALTPLTSSRDSLHFARGYKVLSGVLNTLLEHDLPLNVEVPKT